MEMGTNRASRGFTLIELLTCTGVVGVVLGILLPTLNAARASARLITCGNNVRQICDGLFAYADSYHGLLPMNVSGPKPLYWCDYDRLGRLLTPSQSFLRGPLASCPEDNLGIRSYSMNGWASCLIDKPVQTGGFGTQWRLSISNASRYILVAESWSISGSNAAGWVASGPIGIVYDTPGRKFGGSIGLSPGIISSHFGQANSELPYQRHRGVNSKGRGTQPIGRVNIGYADGHVAVKSSEDLVDPVTGLSTLDSWWSPLDASLNH